MTTEEPQVVDKDEKSTGTLNRKNSLLLTLAGIVSLVYFGLLSILLLAGMIKSGWIAGVMNHYMAPHQYTGSGTMFFFGSGCILHLLAFAGTVLLLRGRKAGYYMLATACLVIASIQLFNPSTAVSSTALYIFFILIFGFFFRRLS